MILVAEAHKVREAQIRYVSDYLYFLFPHVRIYTYIISISYAHMEQILMTIEHCISWSCNMGNSVT